MTASDLPTLTVPSVVPTARWAPFVEKATLCAGSPTAIWACDEQGQKIPNVVSII